MTDSDPNQAPDLELPPDDRPADAAAAPADDGSGAGGEGQWVWQYGAPPPPPSFGASFFSGHANKEHYRFFACALLVVVGCFLPWGPVDAPAPVPGGDGSVAPLVIEVPDVLGVETPAGAISLLIGLWLMFAACHGVYTGRHKILPVFLMIEPAIVTWLRTIDAWGRLEGDTLQNVQDLFVIGGTGVLLTLIGSTWVAAGFLLLLGKVYTKKDDKAARRSSARSKKDDDKSQSKKGSRRGDKADAKAGAGAGGDGAKLEGEAAATPEANGDGTELEELAELSELEPDDEPLAAQPVTEGASEGAAEDEGEGKTGRSRRGGKGRRGRRRR